MSTVSLERSLARPVVSPWLVAVAVVIPTFMEVLDTTIANVALRYIAGGLSAPANDSEWVITSYLAANAIILPISGWLAMRLGRRNYFLLSIAVFTLASALCGMATSLNVLILARVLQGLAGGGLQPSSQAILLDAFPPEKQGAAMTVFGVAALIAPVLGPTLGGYITDNYGWRWIFYLNLPVGLFALSACYAFVSDPEYLQGQRAELRKQHQAFDTLGLMLLSIAMVTWEVLLSKGQEWDWFGDPFWRVQVLTALFVSSLSALVVREIAKHESPDQFPHALGPKFPRVLHHHLLRVWHTLCQHDDTSRAATDTIWLRCDDVGSRVIPRWPVRHHDAIHHRSTAHAWDRRPLLNGGRVVNHGRWKLLDVTAQSRYRAVADRLAAGRHYRGPLNDLCSAQRCCVPAYPQGVARGGRRPIGTAAQRRRQHRNVRRENHSGSPRTVSHASAQRVARSVQPST